MKVTVNDCLQLDSFKNSIVVAGERKMDNRVKAVSVMDAATVEEAVKCSGEAGTMVLTAFAGMKYDVKLQCDAIYELARAGAAALVYFQRGKGYKSIDKEVIAAAEGAGLPLIVVADGDGMNYSAIIEEVMENLLYGNNFENSLINNTIFHLLNFEKHANFQQALHEAAVNNEFQVVLLTEDFNPVFAVETRYQTTINEAIRRGKEAALNLSNIYSLIDIDGVITYWGIVEIQDKKHYLIIVDNDDNYSAGEITKLAEIIHLAMGMWKYTPERDAKTEFVKALMRGNKSLAYSLREEAGVKAGDIISVFYARNIETRHGDESISKFIDNGKLEIIKIKESEQSYAVLMKGGEFDNGDDNVEKAICTQLYDTLKAGSSNVRIFHVTGIDGIEGAGDGFRLIGETWSFVEAIFPYKRVFSKYELALVSNCINIQMQGGHLKKNYMDLLAPFRKEGDNKSRQLLETLETFVLDAGMNSSKTSEFMGIHTNTVQYRLKKINELLGAEITGNRVIPGLTIALALRRMEDTK
ncbi:MAG: PucR family transcriptional regulator [Firmicutes bacterium]|nr:PucR family transcriptional regulator [Bacillota bacterium]